MAKRTTSATRSAPKVASRKSDSKKLGEALGEEMQRVKEHPGMTPQSSTPLDMAQDVTSVSVDMISQSPIRYGRRKVARTWKTG